MHSLKIYSSLNCQTVNISGNHDWMQKAEHCHTSRISFSCCLPRRALSHPWEWLFNLNIFLAHIIFCLFIFRLQINRIIWYIVSIIFCLMCLWDPFMWLRLVVFHSFSWLYGTLVFEYTAIYLCFTISVPWGCFHFWLWVVLWYKRRQWQPTPVLLPGESQGWGSLVGCSPWGC